MQNRGLTWGLIVSGATGLTALIAAGAAVLAIYDKMPVPASVKEYHTEDHVTEREQQKQDSGMLTALTIPPIREGLCNSQDVNTRMQMQQLLDERTARYEELMGRKYTVPPCPQPPPVVSE